MEEKKLISGIFNYCDRWCERCPFTERCAVQQHEKELKDLQQLGIEQHAEANQLKDAFEVISWYMYFIAVKARRATNIDNQEELNFPDPKNKKTRPAMTGTGFDSKRLYFLLQLS